MMLTAEQIENQDYSMNDVADLKMRLQIAEQALQYIYYTLSKNEGSESAVRTAYETAINTFAQIQEEHKESSCEITPSFEGVYSCECDLTFVGE